MTSEIALYNKASVALAADSAGSVGRQVFNNQEKIFQLAGRQPVGFMTYNMSSYMGIRWTRIFGEYRKFLGAQVEGSGPQEAKELPKIQSHDKEYWGDEKKVYRHQVQEWSPKETPKIKEDWDNLYPSEKGDPIRLGYVEHFLHFLDTSPFAIAHLKDNEDSDDLRADELVEFLADEVQMMMRINRAQMSRWLVKDDKSLQASVSKYNKGLERILKAQISSKAEEHFGGLSKEEKRRHKGLLISKTKILNQVVMTVDIHVGSEVVLTRKMRTEIRKLACVFLTTGRRSIRNTSGVVIAGFGEDETTPSVVHLLIHWKWRDEMKVLRINDGKALEEDVYCSNAETFAQSGMVDTLLHGRHPGWDNATEQAFKALVGDFIKTIARKTKGISEDGKLARELRWSARKEAKDHAGTITDEANKMFRSWEFQNQYKTFLGNHMWRLAPPDLASLAEKLVETEVAFQYVTRESRGVGGAVDVASITKENGFMWVKRKDTLDPTLNPRTHHNPRESAQHI